ncbi:MAG: aldose epimerase family protein [Roseinatronobacter sp.]
MSRPEDTEILKTIALHGGGLRARVLTLGAVVQDLWLDGTPFPLVLGSADPQAYRGPLRHVGAMIGRYANRISGAGFWLDGQRHALDVNWRGQHILHGGADGAGQRIWQIRAQARDRVTLGLVLPDGDMGFPGRLDVQVTIRLGPGPRLSFDTRARTDRATPCSFTHHGYFRLDDAPDLRHHHLRIAKAQRIETDADLMPTGRLLPGDQVLDLAQPLDHGFGFAGPRTRRPRPIAWLTNTRARLAMRVESTAPGLQIHTATHGGAMGVALEAQEWPDAPNQPHFPDTILRPGALWRQRTRYIFSTLT